MTASDSVRMQIATYESGEWDKVLEVEPPAFSHTFTRESQSCIKNIVCFSLFREHQTANRLCPSIHDKGVAKQSFCINYFDLFT